MLSAIMVKYGSSNDSAEWRRNMAKDGMAKKSEARSGQ